MVDAEKQMLGLVEKLRTKRAHLEAGGGAERLAKQREQGKFTARERIASCYSVPRTWSGNSASRPDRDLRGTRLARSSRLSEGSTRA